MNYKIFTKNLKNFLAELGKESYLPAKVNISPYMVNLAISNAIVHKTSFLACRFGWWETYSIGFRDSRSKISESIRAKMWNTPGVFPATRDFYEVFYREYTSAMSHADIIGLMRCPYELDVISRHAPHGFFCELQDLEPYFQPNPWTRALDGLRVLVVHPFAQSIEKQFSGARSKLFLKQKLLPEFKLITLKSPQTMCGNADGFSNWLEALKDIMQKVSMIEFDVAIVGCGAYGLPLAAEIKKMGKVCVQLGGATQTLFGIVGERWTKHNPAKFLINEFWKRPDESEKPKNWEKAERGCYW